MHGPKTVIFLDPPEFCIRVESQVAPYLRDRPAIVAAPGAERATVLALSAEARAAGIARGTAVQLAKKICPDLVILPPNPELYARASRALHDVISRFAPIIEPHGWGHAFCDVTGTERLFGTPTDVAWKMSKAVHQEVRLPIAVGVATNKLVSEVAAEVAKTARRQGGKTARDALVPVTPGEEARFLAPNHADLLPDLEEKVRDRLDEYQLDLIGQIAAIPVPDLCAVFGARGRTLHSTTVGIDPRPVLPPALRAEFRVEHTLATDTNDRGELDRIVSGLAEALGRRLRRRKLAARRITLLATYSDWMEHGRTLIAAPLQSDLELRSAARQLFERTVLRTVAIRAVRFVADDLVEENAQLVLPLSSHEERGPGGEETTKEISLQPALDRIHARWGANGIRRATAAGSLQVA